MRAILATILLVAGLTTANASEPVRLSDGLISGEFPAAPRIGNQINNGILDLVFAYDGGQFVLFLRDADWSSQKLDAESFLDSRAKVFEGKLDFTVTTLTLDGRVGRLFVGQGPGHTTISDRLFFINGHLYQAMTVLGPQSTNADQAEVDRFVNSLEIAH